MLAQARAAADARVPRERHNAGERTLPRIVDRATSTNESKPTRMARVAKRRIERNRLGRTITRGPVNDDAAESLRGRPRARGRAISRRVTAAAGLLPAACSQGQPALCRRIESFRCPSVRFNAYPVEAFFATTSHRAGNKARARKQLRCTR